MHRIARNDADMTDISISASDPWYAKLATAILNTSGPLSLIAMGLCAFLMWTVWAQLAAINGRIGDLHAQMLEAKVEMGKFAARQLAFDEQRERLLEQQMRVLRQTCVNVSRSEAAIRACTE